MAEARGIVRHAIGVAVDEGHLIAVAVEALVFRRQLAQVCCRAIGGGGAFVVPG